MLQHHAVILSPAGPVANSRPVPETGGLRLPALENKRDKALQPVPRTGGRHAVPISRSEPTAFRVGLRWSGRRFRQALSPARLSEARPARPVFNSILARHRRNDSTGFTAGGLLTASFGGPPRRSSRAPASARSAPCGRAIRDPAWNTRRCRDSGLSRSCAGERCLRR